MHWPHKQTILKYPLNLSLFQRITSHKEIVASLILLFHFSTKKGIQMYTLFSFFSKLYFPLTGMSSYQPPYISFFTFTWDQPDNELRTGLISSFRCWIERRLLYNKFQTGFRNFNLYAFGSVIYLLDKRYHFSLLDQWCIYQASDTTSSWSHANGGESISSLVLFTTGMQYPHPVQADCPFLLYPKSF